MMRVAWRGAGWGLVLYGLAACADAPAPAPGPEGCDAGCCIADPVAHCVRESCTNSSECPSGTECLERDGGAPVETQCGGPEDRTTNCQLPPYAADHHDRLVRGFKVSRFSLSQGADDPSSFSWKSPKGATLIKCALFGCPPEMTDGDPIRILNYDQCVIASKVFPAGESGFDLLDDQALQRETRQDAAAQCVANGDGVHMKVTTLLVGCWAYNDTGLIGATDLITTPAKAVTDARRFSEDLVNECNEDGLSCFNEEAAFFGTCHSSGCRRRCRTDGDCPAPRPTPSSMDMSDAGAVPARIRNCCIEPGEIVGVCILDAKLCMGALR